MKKLWKKRKGWIVAGGAAVVGGFLWWRNKGSGSTQKAQQTPALDYVPGGGIPVTVAGPPYGTTATGDPNAGLLALLASLIASLNKGDHHKRHPKPKPGHEPDPQHHDHHKNKGLGSFGHGHHHPHHEGNKGGKAHGIKHGHKPRHRSPAHIRNTNGGRHTNNHGIAKERKTKVARMMKRTPAGITPQRANLDAVGHVNPGAVAAAGITPPPIGHGVPVPGPGGAPGRVPGSPPITTSPHPPNTTTRSTDRQKLGASRGLTIRQRPVASHQPAHRDPEVNQHRPSAPPNRTMRKASPPKGAKTPAPRPPAKKGK